MWHLVRVWIGPLSDQWTFFPSHHWQWWEMEVKQWTRDRKWACIPSARQKCVNGTWHPRGGQQRRVDHFYRSQVGLVNTRGLSETKKGGFWSYVIQVFFHDSYSHPPAWLQGLGTRLYAKHTVLPKPSRLIFIRPAKSGEQQMAHVATQTLHARTRTN